MHTTSRKHSYILAALRTSRRLGWGSGQLRAMQIALATVRRAKRDALTQAEQDAYMNGLLDKYLPIH